MPTYEYVCEEGHHILLRNAPIDQGEIICTVELLDLNYYCMAPAKRVPFYLDTAVTRLPTRGPIIPPRPTPRSSKKENTDIWKEMLDDYAYAEHRHSTHYGRGGDLADRYDERPSGGREN